VYLRVPQVWSHMENKHSQPLCMYEDLYADIATILIVMQAAIERMQCYMI